MSTRERQQTDKIALNFDLFQNKLKTHGFEDSNKKLIYEELK